MIHDCSVLYLIEPQYLFFQYLQQLIDELMSYDSASNSSYKQLWRVSDTEFEYNFFHGYDYGVDANTSFSVSQG